MSPEQLAGRLRNADWLRRDETRMLLYALGGAEGRTRAVGGIVRDTLLDVPRQSADIDLATELPPEMVSRRAEAAGAAVYPTGIAHGTVTVRLGDITAEITTLREDIATDGRHAVVRFGTDWRRDAERRDFTMNALYVDVEGSLFDPLGGLADCLAGRVRFIGDPRQRIAEDRLRVYRFFRFAASHGGEKLDAAGLEACADWAGRLGTLSAERIGAEMRRMLALPRIGITLRHMAELCLVPFGSETVGLLHAYERRVPEPRSAARLALILDATDPDGLKARWRLSNDELGAALGVLAAARLVADFRLNEAAYRHPAALADGIEVAAVLNGWTEAGRAAVLEQLRSVQVSRFPLSGADLMGAGYPAGPALGRELERLERIWIESGFALDREALMSRVNPAR